MSTEAIVSAEQQERQTHSSPRSYYQEQIAGHTATAGVVAKSKQVVSRARSAVIGVWLLLFVLALNGYMSGTIAWLLAGVAFVALLVLAAWDERLARRIALANERSEIARIQLARLDREWKNVPEYDVLPPDSMKQASADLDLFGHASLYQLVCRANTPRGRELLRDWLALGASPEEVRERNAAAKQLAGKTEFREELDLRGRMLGTSAAGPATFVEWAEGERWLEKRSWLLLASRVLVGVGVVAVLLAVLGVMPTFFSVAAGIVLAINLLLSVIWAGTVHDIFEKVDSKQNDVVHYRELLDLIGELPTEPKLLNNLREQMGTDAARPQEALTSLARIMQFAQMRHSGLFGVFHLILQLMFLIDFHLLGVLENWHRKYGAEVRGWFDAIGGLEAISSLASVVHDQPDWTFPDYAESHTRFESQRLGHPLLAKPVCNDVSLGPKGTFLLVTGSNMSGKSTLLRTIGLNSVLAQAGAPVNASQLSLPPVEIATSMRIQDSLEDGISFFMAELKRLKEIVDQADSLSLQPQPTMLFLLDEILQGTNSAERFVAVSQVVQQLATSGAMGAISTHDLELASSEELLEIADSVHFRETITDDEMTFDYQMRQGVATTTNALKLLELVGISRSK